MSIKKIITIERQFASGGLETGQKVSELLGIPIYNREILTMAAEKINISEEYLESSEESASASLLMSLSMSVNSSGNIYETIPLPDKLFFAESEIIRNLADKEPCILVGRCADYILRERDDCLKVFIYANDEYRIKRASEVYGLSRKKAEAMIKKNDKRRSGFYTFNSGRKWGAKENYHICLDSGYLGTEHCAEIIAGLFSTK